MGLLKELRLRFRPPRMEDPDFGVLLYMHIPHAPANSYWEGEWLFPATRTKVAIALPGGLDGPDIKARAFYLELSTQFDHVVKQVWPALDRVFREWIGRPLDTDLWKDVRLSGFGVEPLNSVCRSPGTSCSRQPARNGWLSRFLLSATRRRIPWSIPSRDRT